MSDSLAMRLFIDHCVPESVAKALEESGHPTIRLREKIAPDSPDALVAAVAEANSAVLVTMDGDDLPLSCHPAAIRASAGFTPCGAV